MTYAKKMGMLYIGVNPKKLRPGLFLVHNHIRHDKDMPIGEHGFRAWWQKDKDDLTPCKCGWAGLPHYKIVFPNARKLEKVPKKKLVHQ
jgi:hypothetical protein